MQRVIDGVIQGCRRFRESLSDELTRDPASRVKWWVSSCLWEEHPGRAHRLCTGPGLVILQGGHGAGEHSGQREGVESGVGK